MPLLLAGKTEGFKFYLQLTNGTFLRATGTDNLLFSGLTAGQPVNPINSTTHLYSGATHACATTHGYNTARITSNTVSINGGGSTTLPISISSCPILISFNSLEEIITTDGKIFAYDGNIESTPISNVNIYLAEGGVSSTWIAANGVGNYLPLHDSTDPDVEHNFYIAASAEKISGTGQTTGAFKISLSYI